MVLPLLAWLPGVPQRLAMPWWWGISSFLVIGVGLRQVVLHRVRVTGCWLLGCLAIFWVHQTEFGMASKWMTAMLTAGVAAHLVAERGTWTWVRQALLISAWLQVPLCLAQALHWPLPYLTLGLPPWGSLGDRIDLSILWGVASLISQGWRDWMFALLSMATGSWTGSVPAMGWVLWSRLPARARPWVVALALPVMVVGARQGTHLSDRWLVWHNIPTWHANLLTGYGLLSFPGGFTYDDAVSKLIGVRDTHSVWLDWLLRTGVVGAGLLAAVLIWCWRRTVVHRRYGLWLLALWVGTWQSMEGRPFLGVLAWWWVVGLQEDTDGRVDQGQKA